MMDEELREDKIVSVPIGSRINIKSLATLTQYYSSQGIRSQGSMVRAALEALARILVEAGKADYFDSNNEAKSYVNAFYPTKGVGYQKAQTDVSLSGFANQRADIKDTVLGAVKMVDLPKRGEINE